MKNIDLNLNTILDGAVQEQFDLAMEDVLKNIHDLNTEPGKSRKVTVTFKISSNPARETLNVEVDTKTSLVGKQPVMATLLTGEDATGLHARELKSGAKDQTYFDDNGTVRNDDGKPVEKESNVTPIKNKKALFK